MAPGSDEASKPQRSLAAIVFTDICGFSQLAQQDEDRACKLAQRDLGFLRKLCERCGGKVLKSTGDGLLMYFNSATQAVMCAMQAQTGFAEAVGRLPEDQVLRHRIGIHLGDVFVTSDDVMGDGVNVASRLQEQADPGGICVSQTVYDVVKNRLAVHATYLGPRELKNIQEAVPVYQILADAAAQAGTATVAAKPRKDNSRLWMIVVGVGGLVVVLLAVLIGMIAAGGGDDRAEGDVAGNAPVPPPAPPASPQRTDASRTATSRRAGGEQLDARHADPFGGLEAQPFEEARRQYLADRDVAGLVTWMDENGYGQTPMAGMYRRAEAYMQTVRERLEASTPEAPVRFEMPGRRGHTSGTAWSAGAGKVAFDIGGRRQVRMLKKMPSRLRMAIAMGVAESEAERETVAFMIREARATGLDDTREGRSSGRRPPPPR